MVRFEPRAFILASLVAAAPLHAQDGEAPALDEPSAIESTGAETPASAAGATEEAVPTPPPAAEPEPEADDNQLARILRGVAWGSDHTSVLAHFRREMLDEYRAAIAGMRDPIRIDEIRREHEARYQRVEESYEVFDGTRTGYEVSVLGGEVAAGNDESMLTMRTDNASLYYLFIADSLYKVVVAYNSAYLGGLEFDAFLDQVERRYGPAQRTETAETSAGLRYLARAEWEEGDTRLRVVNRSNLFGTYIMVFTHDVLEDRVTQLRGGELRASDESGVALSPLVRQLREGSVNPAPSGRSDIADQIIGSPTVVELHVPEAQEVELEDPEVLAREQAEAEAAEEAAREAERQRRRRAQEQREEEETEGITIY
jgi:hypothetical protein